MRDGIRKLLYKGHVSLPMEALRNVEKAVNCSYNKTGPLGGEWKGSWERSLHPGGSRRVPAVSS